LPYPCPVIALSERTLTGARLPDGSHVWIRRTVDDVITVFAVEQPPWWLDLPNPGFRVPVYPTSDGFSAYPVSSVWTAMQEYDERGDWSSGTQRARSLTRYLFERTDTEHVRLVARREGDWNRAGSAPRVTTERTSSYGNGVPCPSCDERLWDDVPFVEFSDLRRARGAVRVGDASLVYGAGKRARLCSSGLECIDVADASPELANEPASRWSNGVVVARSCGQRVCDVVLLAPKGGHRPSFAPPLQFEIGASGLALTNGQWLIGGDARLGVRHYLTPGHGPALGDVVGLDFRVRALASLGGAQPSGDDGPWISASVRPWVAANDYLFRQFGARQPALIGLLIPEAGLVWRGDSRFGVGIGWVAPITIRLSPLYCTGSVEAMSCRSRMHPYRLSEHWMLEITPELDVFVPLDGTRVETGFGLGVGILSW
jgi:hypothetical protein